MVVVKHTKNVWCKDHGKGCRVHTQLGSDDNMSKKDQRIALNKRFRKAGRLELRGSTVRSFRSTDTFRMNEYPHNQDYIPFRFVSGLNVVGAYYQDEHDTSNYLLYFDKNSRHLPEKLAENLPVCNYLYLWNIDDYWSCEAEGRDNMVPFFYREGARLYVPYYGGRWSCAHYLVEWCHENNKWNEYDKLMERWQSGNARDC